MFSAEHVPRFSEMPECERPWSRDPPGSGPWAITSHTKDSRPLRLCRISERREGLRCYDSLDTGDLPIPNVP
jgi:hypothetical protein